jgi:diguanylate cyclase (GGDEF)-like protein/PAS domain S-box-containing protein
VSSPVRVLLVDGDRANARHLSSMLEEHRSPSFSVTVAATMGEAARHLAAASAGSGAARSAVPAAPAALGERGSASSAGGAAAPALVLFNLTTCDVAGLAGLALLQAEAGDVPIIVLAPAVEENLALKAVQQGAADYLMVEQIYDTLLVRAIRHVVERHDVAQQHIASEQALRASERRYRSLFEQSRDAIVITDDKYVITEANNAAVDLLGYQRRDLEGISLTSLFSDPADGWLMEERLYNVGWTGDMEVRLERRRGSPVWCLFSGARRLDDHGSVGGYQGIIHDITDRKLAEERLLHNAFHDSLTELPNRALFIDRTAMALARWRRDPLHRCAVLFLDLNRFKVVNDSLGHTTGDALLALIARLLSSCMRAEDTVARLGGDEFAILVHDAARDEDAIRAAQRIHEVLAEPLEVDGHRIFTSASIGIAFPATAEDGPQDLLRNADLAMYRAKSAGPGRHALYVPSMHRYVVDLLQLETDLRLALGRSEFILHYQPIIALPHNRVVGFEALIRWQHPQRGLLLPQDFIALAEETGVIVPVGWWGLRQACSYAAGLLRQLPEPHFIAVNLTARQLVLPGLADGVAAILEETGLPPQLLVLEITESALVNHAAVAADSLAHLRRIGVRVCIDEFGTEYSSLSHLHTFEVDALKIDRSFVSRLGPDGERSDLIRTIIAIANRLGVSTVAGGVETPAQFAQLQLLKPTSVQGYLFSMPVDSAAASALAERDWTRLAVSESS